MVPPSLGTLPGMAVTEEGDGRGMHGETAKAGIAPQDPARTTGFCPWPVAFPAVRPRFHAPPVLNRCMGSNAGHDARLAVPHNDAHLRHGRHPHM